MPRPHAVVTLLPRDTRARKRKRTGRRRAWRQPPQKPAAAFERAARRARAIRMTASLSLRFCFSCELSKVFLLRRMRRWPTALDALRKRRSAFSILSARTRVQKGPRQYLSQEWHGVGATGATGAHANAYVPALACPPQGVQRSLCPCPLLTNIAQRAQGSEVLLQLTARPAPARSRHAQRSSGRPPWRAPTPCGRKPPAAGSPQA